MTRSALIRLLVLVLVIAAFVWADAGVAVNRSQANTQVSASTAASGDNTASAAVFTQVEVRVAEGHLSAPLSEALGKALGERAELRKVYSSGGQVPQGTPILRVAVEVVKGWYTPVWSGTHLKVSWQFASDGDIEGLLNETTMRLSLDTPLIRRVKGGTTIVTRAYGLYSRKYYDRLLAGQVATEVTRQLVPNLSGK